MRSPGLDESSIGSHVRRVDTSTPTLEIKGYARANRVVFTAHARRSLKGGRAGKGDVLHALICATRCERADAPDRWMVVGVDTADDSLTLIVVIAEGVVVVTVYG